MNKSVTTHPTQHELQKEVTLLRQQVEALRAQLDDAQKIINLQQIPSMYWSEDANDMEYSFEWEDWESAFDGVMSLGCLESIYLRVTTARALPDRYLKITNVNKDEMNYDEIEYTLISKEEYQAQE